MQTTVGNPAAKDATTSSAAAANGGPVVKVGWIASGIFKVNFAFNQIKTVVTGTRFFDPIVKTISYVSGDLLGRVLFMFGRKQVHGEGEVTVPDPVDEVPEVEQDEIMINIPDRYETFDARENFDEWLANSALVRGSTDDRVDSVETSIADIVAAAKANPPKMSQKIHDDGVYVNSEGLTYVPFMGYMEL